MPSSADEIQYPDEEINPGFQVFKDYHNWIARVSKSEKPVRKINHNWKAEVL
jgi:hypothetical protein